jgi:hypothetical protein
MWEAGGEEDEEDEEDEDEEDEEDEEERPLNSRKQGEGGGHMINEESPRRLCPRGLAPHP